MQPPPIMDNDWDLETAINFILTLNLKFECEFELTKYLRQTEYLFVIHRTSQI
jgi:hypothetical protein